MGRLIAVRGCAVFVKAIGQCQSQGFVGDAVDKRIYPTTWSPATACRWSLRRRVSFILPLHPLGCRRGRETKLAFCECRTIFPPCPR